MSNHWHLVLWPEKDGQLSEFMRLLTVTHTQRWHAHHHTAGTGHLYQGRFKAFPIQGARASEPGRALRNVCRYVERNPLRAKLVTQADAWQWSGLWRRLHGTSEEKKLLADWPQGVYPGDKSWLERLSTPQSPAEEAALATSIQRGRPFGAPDWIAQTARRLGLQHTLRNPGRPRKSKQKNS
jgi:putative transposase